MTTYSGTDDMALELKRVRSQLEDLQTTFDAIRTGGIDAVLIGEENDEEFYPLTRIDRPYRAIVEGMGEGAAMVSQGGLVFYANTRFAQLIGRGAGALVGSDFRALVDISSHHDLDALLLAAEGGSARGELCLVRQDGLTFPAHTSVVGLDIDGVMVRCVIITDLTAQWDTADRLARAAADIVANAAALAKANRELARSNEDLAQFAYVTSHDLSEPLRTITGFAELLATRYDGVLDGDADEFLGFIVSGCDRMQRLINGLLLYSRVGTRHEPLAPLDSGDLVHGILADLHSQIAAIGAVVDVSSMPVVLADETQLSQVFLNLIRNGLTFVATGVVPRICVSAERAADSWEFAVVDNGIGVPLDRREQIFGMFKRLHTQDEYPGTGIGLAIVEKAVSRRGGVVRVDENPDGGSRFEFTVPDAPPGELLEA